MQLRRMRQLRELRKLMSSLRRRRVRRGTGGLERNAGSLTSPTGRICSVSILDLFLHLNYFFSVFTVKSAREALVLFTGAEGKLSDSVSERKKKTYIGIKHDEEKNKLPS